MKIIKDWVDKSIIASLCILIFTLPFSKSMVEVCVIIAFVLWVLKRTLFYQENTPLLNLYKPLYVKVYLPLFLFILAGILSTLTSSSISLSIKGFFFKLLGGVFLFFIITESVNDNKRLNYVLFAMSLSILLIGIDGIFQSLKGWDFLRHYRSFGRVSASFINPNGFGGWIITMLPLAICAACVKKDMMPKKNIRVILWVLAVMLIACLILTRSRGALIGIVFAILFFAAVKKIRIFLITVAFILIVVLIASPYFINAHQNLRILIKESANIRSWDNALSWAKDFIFFVKKRLVLISEIIDFARINLWREAFFIIRDYPVFGCGLNTYSFIAPRYKSGLPESGIYCHNSYLQMTAETGFVGLTTFILFVTSLFITSLINLNKIRNGFYHNILLGLLTGLFGFLVHSFFDVNFYALQLSSLMWFVMGLIMAVQNIALKEEGA